MDSRTWSAYSDEMAKLSRGSDAAIGAAVVPAALLLALSRQRGLP